MRNSLAACVLALTAACASFAPARAGDSILPMASAGATCTAWAVARTTWASAKHCFEMGGRDGWSIGGTPVVVLALDPDSDTALVSGPLGSPLSLAGEPAPIGGTAYTYGYGLGKRTLLIFPATVVAHADAFFDAPELILAGANGMPGMSGGPVLYRGRVVGQVSGGGTAQSPAHLIGSAVPWRALRDFVRLHVGR